MNGQTIWATSKDRQREDKREGEMTIVKKVQKMRKKTGREEGRRFGWWKTILTWFGGIQRILWGGPAKQRSEKGVERVGQRWTMIWDG